MDAKFRVSLMVECIAKVSHSSFSIVCCSPPHSHPFSTACTPACIRAKCRRQNKKKETWCWKANEKLSKWMRNGILLRSYHFYAHNSSRTPFHCVGPVCFDPLFMIISLLMQRVFFSFRAILLYDTAFAIRVLSLFVLLSVSPHPQFNCCVKSVFISYGAYDRRLFMRLKSWTFCH